MLSTRLLEEYTIIIAIFNDDDVFYWKTHSCEVLNANKARTIRNNRNQIIRNPTITNKFSYRFLLKRKNVLLHTRSLYLIKTARMQQKSYYPYKKTIKTCYLLWDI